MSCFAMGEEKSNTVIFMLISFLYILEFEYCKLSNTDSVISRLTCLAYISSF